jgi:hypothetical protein
MSIVHGNHVMLAEDGVSSSPAEGEQARDLTGSRLNYQEDEARDGQTTDPSLAEDEAGYGYGV